MNLAERMMKLNNGGAGMKRLIWIVSVCFLLVFSCSAQAQTLYVSPQGLSLTEALAQCADGDMIELTEGVYAEPTETFPLTVDKRVTIYAPEGVIAVIDAPKFQAAFRVEADRVMLRNLDIRMRRTGVYAIGDDMTLENCSITLEDLAWRTSSCAVWMGGIYRAAFRNCQFTGCSVSIAGPPLSESSKGLPVLTGLFEVGEDPAYFTTHVFENCTVNGKPLFYAASQSNVEAPADAGQIICVGCENVRIQGADVSDTSMGVILAYDDTIHIEQTRADRCGVFGIYVTKCGGGVIEACTVEETNHGIDVRATDSILLHKCIALNCDQGLFFSMVKDSAMKDCIVSGTGQGYFMAAGSGNLLENCEAIACENGYNLQKENDVTMLDCLAEACTVCGVRLDASPTVFSGNKVRNNWVGVMAYGDVAFQVEGNTFDGNQSCGLYLRNIGYSSFSSNTFSNSGEAAVETIGNMAESVWKNNLMDRELSENQIGMFAKNN